MKLSRRSMISAVAVAACFRPFVAAAKMQARSLSAELGCPVLTPESGTAYELAKEIWNSRWGRRPSFIVKCRNATHVARAVLYASKNKIPLSVRSGGHHPAGFAMRDDGLTIDLSEMLNVDVDVRRNRVTIQPGVRIGYLQAMLEPHNLYAVGPMTSTVGATGMIVGGGYGWFSGDSGLAVDNLISAEVVTADGAIRQVDADNDPDLFWAIRGGGGNFGIITSAVMRVHPLKPVTGGVIVYADSDSRSAAVGWSRYVQSPDIPAELFPNLILLPPAPNARTATTLIMTKSSLQGAENDAALARLRSFGTILQDAMRPISLTEMQSLADPDSEFGHNYAVNTHLFKSLPDEAIDIMMRAMANPPSPHAIMLWGPQHGAMAKPGPTDTAYWHRDARINGFIMTRWDDPAEAQKNIDWVNDYWNQLKPYSTGQIMMSFTSWDNPDLGRMCFGGNYDQLSRIKQKYDPNNIFSSTANILPSG